MLIIITRPRWLCRDEWSETYHHKVSDLRPPLDDKRDENWEHPFHEIPQISAIWWTSKMRKNIRAVYELQRFNEGSNSTPIIVAARLCLHFNIFVLSQLTYFIGHKTPLSRLLKDISDIAISTEENWPRSAIPLLAKRHCGDYNGCVNSVNSMFQSSDLIGNVRSHFAMLWYKGISFHTSKTQ